MNWLDHLIRSLARSWRGSRLRDVRYLSGRGVTDDRRMALDELTAEAQEMGLYDAAECREQRMTDSEKIEELRRALAALVRHTVDSDPLHPALQDARERAVEIYHRTEVK